MTSIRPDDTQPVLVRAGEAEVLGVAPNTIELLADGGSAHGVSACRTTMGKATEGPAPHHHDRAAEMFFILSGGLHVLVGDRVVTVGEGDYLLVPPGTPHAFATPDDTGVDMLFLMPETERFEYFRLVDRVRRGQASPQEILDTQDRFDNHFQDSPVWRRFRAGSG